MITASVSIQPAIRSQAGSVKRKKFRGLPKIGSTTLPEVRGANQKSASVVHSAAIAAPVVSAISSDSADRDDAQDRLDRKIHFPSGKE